MPPHCAFDVQDTQTPRLVSQADVWPLQREVLLAEHSPQAPDV
jgi:hypothetical protein